MTNEQKQEVLAALDTYAEIFGPRLTCIVEFDEDGQGGPLADGCCCVLGALGIYDPVGNPDYSGDCASVTFFSWDETAKRFGFKNGEELYEENDATFSYIRGAETPEERFTRMRAWVENYPVDA